MSYYTILSTQIGQPNDLELYSYPRSLIYNALVLCICVQFACVRLCTLENFRSIPHANWYQNQLDNYLHAQMHTRQMHRHTYKVKELTGLNVDIASHLAGQAPSPSHSQTSQTDRQTHTHTHTHTNTHTHTPNTLWQLLIHTHTHECTWYTVTVVNTETLCITAIQWRPS